MTLPSLASVIDRASCVDLMPSLPVPLRPGNSPTPHPPFGRGPGSGWQWVPPPFLPTPKTMLSKPQPDFPSWQRETLDQFAADAATRLVELEEANDQLKQDLRDAMKLLRQEMEQAK